MTIISITSGDIKLEAELFDNDTGNVILNALPLTGSVHTWGDEIYFDIPVNMELEDNASADINIGELAFWPPGNAFCIFFGSTPISTAGQPKAASPVNVFGKIIGDLSSLKTIKAGDKI